MANTMLAAAHNKVLAPKSPKAFNASVSFSIKLSCLVISGKARCRYKQR